MEFIDIVNDKDEVIGKTSYNEIYKRLLSHRIVHVLIYNNKGEMALHLRSKHKSFCPLHWVTPASGHVRSGETYKQAALRELKEELGIKINIKFIYKDLYIDKTKEVGLKKFLTTCKTIYNGPFKINPKEVEKLEFFSLIKIQEMINNDEKFHPELLFLLKKHFNIKE